MAKMATENVKTRSLMANLATENALFRPLGWPKWPTLLYTMLYRLWEVNVYAGTKIT